MRRIVVGLAAALLLGGSAIASIPPACADTFIKGLKVSQLVRVSPGWSVGLVTVTAGGGKVRHDEDYMAETSIKVAPTSWVGTVPTTLWVDGGVVDHPTKGRLMTVRASGFAPEAFGLGRDGSSRSAMPMPGCPTTHCQWWATPCESRSLPQTTSMAVTKESSTSTPYGTELRGGPDLPRPEGGHPPDPSTGAELTGRPHLPRPDGGYLLNPSTLVFPKPLLVLRPSAGLVDPAAG